MTFGLKNLVESDKPCKREEIMKKVKFLRFWRCGIQNISRGRIRERVLVVTLMALGFNL